jgi:hypothetical protein
LIIVDTLTFISVTDASRKTAQLRPSGTGFGDYQPKARPIITILGLTLGCRVALDQMPLVFCRIFAAQLEALKRYRTENASS